MLCKQKAQFVMFAIVLTKVNQTPNVQFGPRKNDLTPLLLSSNKKSHIVNLFNNMYQKQKNTQKTISFCSYINIQSSSCKTKKKYDKTFLGIIQRSGTSVSSSSLFSQPNTCLGSLGGRSPPEAAGEFKL